MIDLVRTNIVRWHKPRTGLVVGSMIVLGLLGFILRRTPNIVGIVITAVFFLFIILMLLSSRWVLTSTYFGSRNLFWQTIYPLKSIIKIYAAKIPNDPKVFGQAEKLAEVVAAGSTATGQPMGYPDASEIKQLASKMGLMQLWVDMGDESGTRHSFPLMTKEKKTYVVGKKQLGIIIKKLAQQYPDKVEQSALDIFKD